MPWAVAGAVAAAGIGVAGQAISSGNSAQAAQTSSVQLQAAELAAQQTSTNYGNQAIAGLTDYQYAGQNALGAYMQAMGLGPNGSTGQINASNFQAQPGYQFQLQQGQQAITNAAAAAGGIGGNTLKSLDTYSQGVANQGWQSYLNGLQNLTSAGQNAVNAQGDFRLQTSSQVGNAAVGAGNAQAAGTVGVANAQNQLTSGLGSNVSNGLAAYKFLSNQPNGSTNPGTSDLAQPYNVGTASLNNGYGAYTQPYVPASNTLTSVYG